MSGRQHAVTLCWLTSELPFADILELSDNPCKRLHGSAGTVAFLVDAFLCGVESLPTPVRGHFLGFAAAVGTGAAIGTQVFTPIQNSFSDSQQGVQGVFLIRSRLCHGWLPYYLVPDS